MRGLFGLLAILVLASGAIRAPAADAVFNVSALISTPLNPRVLKTTEKDGIITEEVMFHSEVDGTNKVEIFALFSYPKGAQRLPAFVWNQSGLYQATPYFTEYGARKGYAALCIDFPIPGYRSTGRYPINSGLALGEDPRQAPIYHGAVALLKAVSFLESRPEVDKDRIGMAGSSWGGFYTTLMAGIDPRLKAAACMFGTGNMQLGNNWWDGGGPKADYNGAFRERWRTTLDPGYRLPKSKAAIAWFTGSNDGFYWMPALMASFEAVKGPRHLTLLPNWDHGLTPVLDEQVFVWFDVHLQGAPGFVELSPLAVRTSKDRRQWAEWSFKGSREIRRADLMLSYGKAGNWVSRYWIVQPVAISGNVCRADWPASSLPYYIAGSCSDTQEYRYSTALLYVPPSETGKAAGLPAYNGCSLWGGFEAEHVGYLKALGHMNPTVTNAAYQGKQALVLTAGGATVMKPLDFTAGLPHRFRCHMKADRETDVGLTLAGSFDGQQRKETKTARIAAVWTDVALDYLPPEALCAGLSAVATTPVGATVVIDEVEFVPLAVSPKGQGL
jgi:dienelactone hydrolase